MRHTLLILWILVFAAFHMAWTAHESAAFTLNAFDLAEQVGIHPAIQNESPPLRTSGELRFAIPLIAFGIALTSLLYTDLRLRWILRAVAVFVALRVVPPESAWRNPDLLLDDIYARQFFQLTLLGLFLVLLTIPLPSRRLLQRYAFAISAIIAVVSIILPLVGYNSALSLLQDLGLEISIGAGLAFYVGLLVVIGGIAAREARPQGGRTASVG